MKYRFWWCLWMVLGALQTVCLWCISGMAWFTGLVQRWANAAEIEMLLARVERKTSLKRGAKAARGGKP